MDAPAIADAGEEVASPEVLTPAIAEALDQVGPRLKGARTQRRMTLTRVPALTGISKSGSTGREPAEILSIFSRPGERMSVGATAGQGRGSG
jgi:hypothetical protein